MNYKTLTNLAVACCMLSGVALMAYVEVEKRSLEHHKQVEAVKTSKTKICSLSKAK